MASFKIGSGSTTPGSTNWKQYPGGRGVYVDIDTSSAGFTATPLYLTTIGGRSGHWATTGATSIYKPTKTKFRIYVRWADGNVLSPAQANASEWHINWVGTQD